MTEKNKYIQQVEECVAFLREQLPFIPSLVIQLGTGLGGLAGQVKPNLILPYYEIPNFPCSTVSSHQGNLIIGHLHGTPVIILQGRFHCYEGYSSKEVAFPIRVLSLLGVRTLILTNAAGGLNPAFAPGSIMIFRDHLNLLGDNPLRGPNVDSWGPRFPDFSIPYNPELIKVALESAETCGLDKVVTGVYACIPGPSLETPAETRWLRGCGADAVGMSSIPEIIVARHAGMDVLGLSVISNVNDPDKMQPIILEEIIAAAGLVEPQLERLIIEIIRRIYATKTAR
ncbi:MAG: purine-nucleoside phosphorylase [Proteobacteria bacterium]|nr:purine-nucleoside phosphorylase [Desulfocapsa sp.]MBU3944820.1 purine-nucleoside phosphorylase [Pseudomonadota bacterium]MCG2745669.1 purine-nucleoside phosphorylase [Desulfobacteraceae bacterium]MBU3983375.1 purine-nucleoside phosphorylase [Pseudomonadota bacterium]MBU4029419.1 purine-nucleoside phosphorylase [Pseudomonadota bacterium]